MIKLGNIYNNSIYIISGEFKIKKNLLTNGIFHAIADSMSEDER